MIKQKKKDLPSFNYSHRSISVTRKEGHAVRSEKLWLGKHVASPAINEEHSWLASCAVQV